jgi:hypothetical protein
MAAAFRSTVLILGVCLAFALSGCGNSSKPKPAEQPAAAAEPEEKAEAPAEKPAKIQKRPEAKPAPPPVARRRPDDPMKWDVADLQSGLSAHDGRFVPAVVGFSMQHLNGAKQAGELKGLLERAGQLKDDPGVSLPLSPGVTTTPTATAAAANPVTPPVAATPPADSGKKGSDGAVGKRRGRRFVGGQD